MATARALRAGLPVIVNSGPYKGLTATVINPTVFPDGHEYQRKVIVDIDGVGHTYIIPKQLDLAGFYSAPKPVTQPEPSVGQTVAISVPTLITSLDDPALDEYRPQRKGLQRDYVSRTLAGDHKDVDVLASYWERRRDGYATNVGLVGDTQSGKTMLVEVMAYTIAKKMGLSKPLPVFTLSGSSAITDHDLFGQYRPTLINGEEKIVWMEGIVALACRLGGILYLDEVNAMPGNVTSALHPVLDDRRQFVNIRKPVPDGHGGYKPEVVNVSTDLWVLCTYNPGYAGMAKTNEAFANRFEWLTWDYDEDVERKLIKSPSIRLLGQALRVARDNRAVTTPVGTSALQRLEQNIATLGLDYAMWSFLGQFTSKAEKAKVQAIIEERSIRTMLEAELAPVADDLNAQRAPFHNDL